MSKRRYNPTKKEREARKATKAAQKQSIPGGTVANAIRDIKGLSPEDQAIALLVTNANQLTANAIDTLAASKRRRTNGHSTTPNPSTAQPIKGSIETEVHQRLPSAFSAPTSPGQPEIREPIAATSKPSSRSLFNRISPRSLFDRIDASTVNRGAIRKN